MLFAYPYTKIISRDLLIFIVPHTEGGSTINLRANSGNAGPTVSITGSTTGIFNDNTNTYSAATTDAINYQVVTASTGTSIKIAFIALWGNSAVQVTPVTKYKHFKNVPPMKPPSSSHQT
jgi:hypothetical protein